MRLSRYDTPWQVCGYTIRMAATRQFVSVRLEASTLRKLPSSKNQEKAMK